MHTVAGTQKSSGRSHLTSPRAVVEPLADVALVDAKAVAAAACISITYWFELVAAGRAPQPVIRGQRFTRWRATDVRDWLERIAAAGSIDGRDSAAVSRRTSGVASGAAAAARRAKGQPSSGTVERQGVET